MLGKPEPGAGIHPGTVLAKNTTPSLGGLVLVTLFFMAHQEVTSEAANVQGQSGQTQWDYLGN